MDDGKLKFSADEIKPVIEKVFKGKITTLKLNEDLPEDSVEKGKVIREREVLTDFLQFYLPCTSLKWNPKKCTQDLFEDATKEEFALAIYLHQYHMEPIKRRGTRTGPRDKNNEKARKTVLGKRALMMKYYNSPVKKFKDAMGKPENAEGRKKLAESVKATFGFARDDKTVASAKETASNGSLTEAVNKESAEMGFTGTVIDSDGFFDFFTGNGGAEVLVAAGLSLTPV